MPSNLRDLNTAYETVENAVTLVQNKWTRLCGVDAGRWSLVFTIPQGQTTTPISTRQVGTTGGFQATAQVPQITITAREMPGGVGGEWYAFTSAVTGTVTVFQTRDIQVPKPEGA
jgi:hypothetical protein